ncbi:MAG: GNAT family N-acetyltransferase, partial [Oscillospiraceae bacterium]|nr:GNAT family N-acetyltransferase [Oscillospiraceae bacterium]
MEINYNGYLISDDRHLVQPDRMYEMLSKTYWGKYRTKEMMQTLIDHSLCFGIYKDDTMVGFARCVTDYAALYYLCDVVIDDAHRGIGLGKVLVKTITEHEKLAQLLGLLDTDDAHGLYAQFGFKDRL